MVRNPELDGIFNSMTAEGKLLKRPMWDNRGKYLRKFVERVLPSKDLMNLKGYVATGQWNPSQDLFNFIFCTQPAHHGLAAAVPGTDSEAQNDV